MKGLKNFNDDRHEISCRITNTIIAYVRQENKDVKFLLEDLPFDEKYLTDTNNWISRALLDEMYRRLRAMFDDDEFAYKIALASERLHTLGFLDYTARLMGNPHFIIKQAPKLNKYFDRTEEIEVVKYGPTGAIVKYYPKPGNVVKADDCYYVKGTLAALPNIWGIGPAKIWEEYCCTPIDKKGRINGKYYTVDGSGSVIEHDAARARLGKDEPRVVGKVNSDGTFKLDKTTYGAKYCLYYISWSGTKMFFKRIFYELCKKPRILMETVEEMQRENDLIQQKYEELFKNNLKLQRHYVDTISALIKAVDAKDHYTESHSIKVAKIAEVIAEELRLPSKKIETIKRACKLHDLGKIGIKESILLKPTMLTEEEWKEIKKHPVLGAEIIKPLSFLSEVAVLVRQDHERWDGKGYPDGLRGEKIDIGARIIMVSDAYDAIITGRPYKKASTKSQTVEEIRRNSGTQFDPKVVKAFLRIVQCL